MLNDAHLRLARAREHLEYIELAAASYAEDSADRVHLRIDGLKITMVGESAPPPADLAVRVGEFAYNLRAALDYLVFALALLGSGVPQEQTQFPIADSPKAFEKQANRRLPGVAEEHRALFEQVQPYRGAPELAQLRDLSNGDKHRAIQILGVVGSQRVTVTGTDHGVLIPAPMVLCLPPDLPLVDLLRSLEERVRSIIERFERLFLQPAPGPAAGSGR